MQIPAPEVAQPLTTMGWVFMVSSLTFVLSLVTFCYWRVLSQPRKPPPPPVKDFHSA